MGLSRYYMRQPKWYMDPQNATTFANNSNSGVDAAHPIRDDDERVRRMGIGPYWNAGAYDIYYLSDVPANQEVRFDGDRASNSSIRIHGSATAGQGQSTIYSGTINTLTPLNRATNQPYEIVSNGLATTWSAAGALNHRIRMTSGVAGAKAWPIKDLGSKRARISQFTQANNYVVPFASSTTSAIPSASNTFVVEKLTAIPNFHWSITASDDFSVNFGTSYEPNVIESLDIGAGNLTLTGSDWITFDGCEVRMYSDNPTHAMSLKFVGCGFRQEIFFAATLNSPIAVYGGYGQGQFLFIEDSGGTPIFDTDFMMQGGYILSHSPRGCVLANVAVFDSPSHGIQVHRYGRVSTTGTADANSSGANWWGSGNAQYGLSIGSEARIGGGPTAGTITGAAGDVVIGTIPKVWAQSQFRELTGGGMSAFRE